MMRSLIKKGQNNIARLLVRIMQYTHRMVIGGQAGHNMMRFAKNLSVTFASGLGVFFVLFVTNVIVARVLGPEEYGKYAVIFSIAQIMMLLFTLELDVSALYFLTDAAQDKKKIISSILIMFVINIIAFSILAISIFQFFNIEQISHISFFSALVMAVMYAGKRLMDAFLRAQDLFVTQAILRIVEAICVCACVIALFYVADMVNAFAYIASIIFGAAVFVLSGMTVVRSIFSVRHSTVTSINEVFRYNIYGLINAVVNGIVKNVDTLLVATFLGTQMAGIYAVYFTAVVVFGARMTQLVMNVFFPTVRAHKNNIIIIHQKVTQMMLRTIVPLAFFASIGIGCVVLFYGDAYPFVWQWIVLGGIYIAVHFFVSLYGYMLSSISQEGYRQYNISFMYGVGVYGMVVGGAFMLNVFSITTLIIAMIAYRVCVGVYAHVKIKHLYKT